jgi:predicted Fe-S protein YdhL (DUF1289 family)
VAAWTTLTDAQRADIMAILPDRLRQMTSRATRSRRREATP